MRAARKIFISGTSGAGKTTLAKYISARYRIPFISSSAKELWGDYGVNSHKELIELTQRDPAVGLKFQYDLLDYRAKVLEGESEFVTDRGPLDNLVYFMTQCSYRIASEETENYIRACKEAYPSEYTQIYLTANPLELELDGYRIDNKYYQMTMDALFMFYEEAGWLSTEHKPTNHKIIVDWDWEKRVKEVDRIFTHRKEIGLWQNLKTKLRL